MFLVNQQIAAHNTVNTNFVNNNFVHILFNRNYSKDGPVDSAEMGYKDDLFLCGCLSRCNKAVIREIEIWTEWVIEV